MKRVFLIILLFGFGCNTEGHRGSSKNIAQSKDKGVFISEFSLVPGNIMTKEIMDEKVRSAFMEYSWFHNSFKSIIDTTAVNLVLEFEGEDWKEFVEPYLIENQNGQRFTPHSKTNLWILTAVNQNKLVEGNMLHADTIRFEVFKEGKSLGAIFMVRGASTQHKI